MVASICAENNLFPLLKPSSGVSSTAGTVGFYDNYTSYTMVPYDDMHNHFEQILVFYLGVMLEADPS